LAFGHTADQPFLSLLFVVNGVTYLVLAVLRRDRRWWRPVTGLLLLGTIVAYLVLVGSGREQPDPVGILDKLAEQEELNVEQAEIGQYVTQLAYQQGVSPDQLARQLASSGQLSAVVADVMRTKAVALLAERATVTDQSGRPVVVGAGAEQSEADGAEDAESGRAEAEEQTETVAADPPKAGRKRGSRRSA